MSEADAAGVNLLDGTREERPPARRWAILVVAVACLALAVACSDDPEELPAPNTSEPSSEAANTPPNDDCPFSGATTPSKGDGTTSGAVISKLTPDVAGCIDNMTVEFSTPPPAWDVAYATGPFVDATTGETVTVPGPVTLVVTFSGTSYPGIPGGTTPGTIPTNKGNYVAGIAVINGTGGSLQFIVSLPEQLEFVTSQSKEPSNFVLSVG